ncbi:hypothetical protein CDD82_4264 [Ophiocordyceps australis]|uniref:Alpha/beta hydrolase fold-3 domain-containing protein n=1 Tax=Ophiocordyceps australis TaxID=1399860 RepID=A0A2C5ZUB7_9HYPO|nr:hypothetical protein CDD82_4264 [Ophiocordyceps australis]
MADTSVQAPPEVAAEKPHVAQSSKLKMARMLLPKLPLILRVTVAHMLNLSEAAPYLDLRSHVIVSVMRAFLQPNPSRPPTISSAQRWSLQDHGIPEKSWISTYVSLPPPETGAKDAVESAIYSLCESRPGDGVGAKLHMPEYGLVEGEWTGYRMGNIDPAALSKMSEKAKYDALTKESSQPTTTIYFHGGAYHLFDPAFYRATCKKLAKLTGGRCYSVRYRLAPKHPFPAALLDAFVSYLTLLYPPRDAYHDAVSPNHIVLSGDSAGGNLSLALLQLILELHRQGQSVEWQGELRKVPIPAGVACNSPWVDITGSAPTIQNDEPALFDYLSKASLLARTQLLRPCPLWPASPPRRFLYTTEHLASHPLVSPITARSWAGSPPIWLCTGWELLQYEDRFMAKKLAADGVPVVFEEYEAMPHVFAMVLPQNPAARLCFDRWAAFIRAVAEDAPSPQSSATLFKAKTLREEPLRFDNLSDISPAEVCDRVRRSARERPEPEVLARL